MQTDSGDKVSKGRPDVIPAPSIYGCSECDYHSVRLFWVELHINENHPDATVIDGWRPKEQETKTIDPVFIPAGYCGCALCPWYGNPRNLFQHVETEHPTKTRHATRLFRY